MTSKRRRILVWAGAGLAVATLIVLTSRPRPLPVDIAPVARGPLGRAQHLGALEMVD